MSMMLTGTVNQVDRVVETLRTCQHVLVPSDNLLVRHLGTFTALIHQHAVGVYDPKGRDVRVVGGIDELHVGGEFAVDGTGEADSAPVSE